MMNLEQPPRKDFTQGDAAKAERAAARTKAMMEGTLAEFDAAEAMARGEVPKIEVRKGPVDYRAGDPEKMKAAQEKMSSLMPGGDSKPEAPKYAVKEVLTEDDFKRQARAIKDRNPGDPRTEEQIVESLKTHASMGRTMNKDFGKEGAA